LVASPRSRRYLEYVLSAVGEAFGSSSEKDFGDLARQIRHSRKTVYYWLKSLERQGYLSGLYIHHRRGRPRLAYRVTGKFKILLENRNGGLDMASGFNRKAEEPVASSVSVALEAGREALGHSPDQGDTDYVLIPFEKLRLICPFRTGESCKAVLDRRHAQECNKTLCSLILQYPSSQKRMLLGA